MRKFMTQDEAFTMIVDNKVMLKTILENQIQILEHINPEKDSVEIQNDIEARMKITRDEIIAELPEEA